MARYRCQVNLIGASGLPRDVFENIWHFSSAATAANDADTVLITTQLASFYTGAGPSGLAIYLSSVIGEEVLVKFYDEDSVARPRVLLSEHSFGLTASGTDGIPEEIALCLSYYSTANQPRHRGRLYIGPFNSTALVVSGGTDEGGHGVRPATGLMTNMTTRAEAVITAGAAAGVIWCLRSGVGGVRYEPVTHGWVDNEWDSARRRRIEASSRVTF